MQRVRPESCKKKDMRLSNKVAIITGGAQGIGLETAKLLASEGAAAVIGDLGVAESTQLRKLDFEGAGNLYEGRLDVTDEEGVKKFVRMVADQFGKIDILVNNAGICRNAMPIEDIPRASWDKVLNVNTFGTINCTNAVIPLMKARKSGKIINSTSVAAEVGGIRTEAGYGMSKASNIFLTMSLAKYLGPYNINVNAVSPGIIDTDMTRALDPADVGSIPLRRVGQPKDVANVILFLASDLSDYLTGAVIDVNGGMYMR